MKNEYLNDGISFLGATSLVDAMYGDPVTTRLN